MISLAMTTYNGEKYIIEQLESIKKQTLTFDEVVIFDDMSTDSTYELICEYIKKNSLDWVVKKNDKNIGYIRNFFNAIDLTSGDIIFLSDQDDIWLPEKVEIMVNHMKNRKIKVLNSSMNLIDSDGNVIDKEKADTVWMQYQLSVPKNKCVKVDFYDILRQNKFPGCTMCFDSEIKNHLISAGSAENFPHDWEINIIGSIYDSSYFLNMDLINYRIHSGNAIGISNDQGSKFNFDNILDKTRFLNERINVLASNNKRYSFTNEYINYLNKMQHYTCNRMEFLNTRDFKSFVNNAKSSIGIKKFKTLMVDTLVLLRIIK